jgi:hypothetical protein
VARSASPTARTEEAPPFWFTIPLQQENRATGTHHDPNLGRPVQILLVEDSPSDDRPREGADQPLRDLRDRSDTADPDLAEFGMVFLLSTTGGVEWIRAGLSRELERDEGCASETGGPCGWLRRSGQRPELDGGPPGNGQLGRPSSPRVRPCRWALQRSAGPTGQDLRTVLSRPWATRERGRDWTRAVTSGPARFDGRQWQRGGLGVGPVVGECVELGVDGDGDG